MAGMKYKDIADQYDTTINTVKSWKKRYGWNGKEGAPQKEKVCTQNKKSAPAPRVEIDDGTKEILQNGDLTPEQQMFCIYYSRTFNAAQSYLKVKVWQIIIGATPDGNFGSGTETLTKTWQNSHRLTADGIVGLILKMQKIVEDKGKVEGTIHRYLIVAKKQIVDVWQNKFCHTNSSLQNWKNI